MSTWQIFSDAGGDNFRWEISGRLIRPDHDSDPTPPPLDSTPAALPSMADLLLQGGCSKLLERNEDGAAEKLPMFQTGLGKSVALKESSIAKALSILGGDNGIADSGEFPLRENGFGSSNSLFQTGSGKKVNVSSAGLIRAKALLGLGEDETKGFNHVKKQTAYDVLCAQELLPFETRGGVSSHGVVDATSVARLSPDFKSGFLGTGFENEVDYSRQQSADFNSASEVPPIKFQTAGGKSLSVSTEALKRARSLLGDPELVNFLDEGEPDNQFITPIKERRSHVTSLSKGNSIYTSFSNQDRTNSEHTSNSFISPLHSSSKQLRSLVNSENSALGSNLIKKFDAAVDKSASGLVSNRPVTQNHVCNRASASESIINSPENVFGSRTKEIGRPAGGPLADITNHCGPAYATSKACSEKRRLGRTASVSPFKRPRNSKFITPLNKNVQHVPSSLSVVSSQHSSPKEVLSTRYPGQVPKIYVKEYFGLPPSAQIRLEHLPDQVRSMNSNNADKYVFADESGLSIIGAEAFYQMLAEFGASAQHASREWVTNHYRWIVWKLACYERFYPVKCAGKFLTISNVFEELKYRYEREVNHGSRSAIMRILAGDAPASSMLVLCISAIHSNSEAHIDTHSGKLNGTDYISYAKIELTDGWYCMDAALDALLTNQLAARKLFVGQKLRIWGARLCGWAGPTSPLEESKTVSLLLNINGTYRAHWAERLGFCKAVCAPLAFSCIKNNGGPVPRTLVGITRIYPILYKERLGAGKSVVRSERTESKMMQLHNQRRSVLVEGIMSEHQRWINGLHGHNDSDSEEGAKVFKLLETAAEPEVIMAEMSPEQLASFATYKAKLEAAQQTEMEKSIQKAIHDAGLGDRDVTPFMRVRVVGLTIRNNSGKHNPKEGIVTIWNPTEKQKTELAEGQVYIIEGLVPMNSDSGTLYLQARGSTVKWQPLSLKASQHFQPFYNPRKSISLSNLGEVPLSSEFDVAAFVVYVGEVYKDVQQKKQWVFVTDGSILQSQSRKMSHHLLAISFCSPYMDDNLFPQVNYNLAGSTVSFCNLIKRSKDQQNDLWVAEATENSIYFLNVDSPYCSHLRSAHDSAQRWANISNSVIEQLREKVLFIVGHCKE